jgi:hypothetical protein
MLGSTSNDRLNTLREGKVAALRRIERARTLVAVKAYQALELTRGGPPSLPACSVPVVINNRNRLEYLRRQVAWLESAGFEDVLILDNDSSYAPLLEWYEGTRHEVVHLGANLGRYALWNHPVFERVRRGYYIYTDSDVVPCERCPADFLDFFFEALGRFPWCEKVGFGLRIDDVPSHYAAAGAVRDRESRHWTKPYSQHLYDASIDTTFALYRPFAMGGHWCKALRTAGPYQAQHLPWYENSSEPSEEQRHHALHRAARHATRP